MKKLVILGGGESGVGTAILGKKKGWDVFLSEGRLLNKKYRQLLEEHGIQWEEGKHTEEKIIGADCIMKSPGIPDNAPVVVKALEKGIPIISEIEFANQYSKGEVIGITGSNGKTTTTMLTHHILEDDRFNVGLAGNIGYSYARQVAEDDKPFYVLEISSFQLDGIRKFAPHIATLINITPDHLDRYDYSFEKYIASKFRIAMNQSEQDYLIYDADDKVITEWLEKNPVRSKLIPFSVKKKMIPGAYLEENKIIIMTEESKFEIATEDLLLKGTHNVKNTMAASAAAQLMRVRKESLRNSLQTFKGVAHRLETVMIRDGVTYINDSKATNVNSVYYAFETIQKPIIWIVGGEDKGNDYNTLLPFVHEKVKSVICLGLDNRKIINSFQNIVSDITETQSMKEAVDIASKWAKPGDTVLLSPACASFDLFKSYEDRGNQFKDAIKNL